MKTKLRGFPCFERCLQQNVLRDSGYLLCGQKNYPVSPTNLAPSHISTPVPQPETKTSLDENGSDVCRTGASRDAEVSAASVSEPSDVGCDSSAHRVTHSA